MYVSVLSRYLIRSYFSKFFLVLLVVIAALILSNIFDLLHRIRGVHLQYEVFFQLVFLKIPYLVLEILPLVIMLTTFLMHFVLTRYNELLVIWGSGISIYRLLIPITLVTFAMGILCVLLINPISTHMLIKYENLESKFTDRKTSFLILSSLGVMISEHYYEENRIYMAKSVVVAENKMINVSVFFTDNNNNFLKRLEAKRAIFAPDNKIKFYEVSIYTSDNRIEHHSDYEINSNLLISNLVEGVTSPDHLNFWQLPEAISKLSKAGFPIFKHQIYYTKLLFKPFAMIAYMLLAICFISNETRSKNRTNLMSIGLFSGLVVYLMSQIFSNIMAYNGTDIVFAVLLPIIIVILTCNFIVLHWRRD